MTTTVRIIRRHNSLYNISVIKPQHKLNDINTNQHTTNAIISLLRNKYSAMNEDVVSELYSHTNMVVLVKQLSICCKHTFPLPHFYQVKINWQSMKHINSLCLPNT